jgi:translation initiation factor IF-2
VADAGKTSSVGVGARSVARKARTIEIPDSVGVRELAGLLHISAIEVIKQLMRNGIMANINQVINYEVAAVIITDFGFEPRHKVRAVKKLSRVTGGAKEDEKTRRLRPRPPVVTIMGHVDHGKTRLLDAIRQSNVMEKEAGGITQHIGAYQVEVNGQKITFLDTPGHEAFTAMRARGAQVTDIAVLVVAADDGVMPQTREAIDHARAAGVPIVVALNKIDKDNANPDLVKQQLAEIGVVIEEWGGDVVCIPVSAKAKIGISELLENLLIVAEMGELKADPTQPALGVVIESEMDKTRGPLATVLVQEGTLRVGDTIVVGTTWGRIKAMYNDAGKQIRKAEPATPAEVLGLADVPEVGDTLKAVVNESQARAIIEERRQQKQRQPSSIRLDNLFDQITAGKVKELNIILKTDVQGSIEPIKTSLEHLATGEVKVRLLHSDSGNVTEGDVMLAIASEGLIVAFGAGIDPGAKKLAEVKGIDIHQYNIIYNLVDDVEKALKGMLEPVLVEVIEGKAEVRATFPGRKGIIIAGVYITEGKASRSAMVRVVRGGKVLAESTQSSLRRFKDDVKEVAAGFECGASVEGFNDFKEGDILEFFRREQSVRSK